MGHTHSQAQVTCVYSLQTVHQGMVPSSTFPNSRDLFEHFHSRSLSTVAGWGVAGWAGQRMVGTGELFVYLSVSFASFIPVNTASYTSFHICAVFFGEVCTWISKWVKWSISDTVPARSDMENSITLRLRHSGVPASFFTTSQGQGWVFSGERR